MKEVKDRIAINISEIKSNMMSGGGCSRMMLLKRDVNNNTDNDNKEDMGI